LPPASFSVSLFSAAPFDAAVGCVPGPTCINKDFLNAAPGTYSIIPTCSGPGPCEPLQGVSVTLSAFPSPSITDAGSTEISGWVQSRATIQYDFEVVASAGPSKAPVNIVSTGSSTLNGDAGTDIGFELRGPDVPDADIFTEVFGCGSYVAQFCAGGTGTVGFASFDFNKTLELDTNTPYSVAIDIIENDTCFSGVGGLPGCGLAGSFSDTIDPFIAIDPGFLALHPELSLVLSPGVGNGPISVGVPEPSSLTLIGMWVLGYGLLLYRRKPRRYDQFNEAAKWRGSLGRLRRARPHSRRHAMA
jgi:hypothetical protein